MKCEHKWEPLIKMQLVNLEMPEVLICKNGCSMVRYVYYKKDGSIDKTITEDPYEKGSIAGLKPLYAV